MSKMPVPEVEESLFSLELVIDKLYIPHVVCRFPSVAFRLLDFPTILINHVDQELGDRIKNKISRDPHYTPPEQFSELQDNHGNYMVKKGKSCLFKTSVDSLKTHLSNTPLYVMALDMYPHTPKLIGNSSVPLDSLMKHICADIAKKGLTVPSVHGDKGLFKIYNLMGKEIGYIVLGFRLLCLGPSMAGHIPNKAITTNNLVTQVEKDNSENELNVINVQPSVETKQISNFSTKVSKPPEKERNLRTSQEMGSMTDAMTSDVMLQTIPTEEKGIHVVISESEKPRIPQSNISTQTEKKRRRNQHILQKDVDISMEDEGANFLDEPNIFCPPPLFYNKYAEPKLQIERPVYYTDEDSFDDLSETGSICEKLSKIQDSKEVEENPTPRKSNMKVPLTVQDTRKLKQNKTVNIQGPVSLNNPVFPILTALLNELVGIQGSQGLENVIQRVGHVSSGMGHHSPRQPSHQRGRDQREINVARPTLSSQSKKSSKKDEEDNKMSKNKSWIRKTPQSVPKTGKLTYRLTKTQKMRIAMSNPRWLKEKERVDESLKPKPPLTVVSEEDLSVTNFSDTLTEVRRLAEKELANETLDSVQDLGSSMKSSHPSPKHKRKHHHKKKPKAHQSPSKSPKTQPDTSLLLSSQSKSTKSVSAFDVRSALSKATPVKGFSLKSVQSSPMIIEHDETHPRQEAVEPDLRRFVSDTGSDESSADRPSGSKEHAGVEVRLPRAPIEDESDEEISLPDNDVKGRKLSTGLIEQSTSFRESILGKSHDSVDADDPGPLESTRTSQSYQNDFTDSPRKSRNDPKEATDSRIYQSTTDNDTRQFLSTEEPELKELVSGGESESVESPRYVPTFADTSSKPSVRSSMKFPVLNPISSEQSPIPTTRKSTIKSEGHLSKASENASSAGSSMVPTPRVRRFPRVRDSIHTESVSSYQPSDDGVLTLNSDANYSDDFQNSGSIGSVSDLSPDLVPRRIPSTKLGYTIS